MITQNNTIVTWSATVKCDPQLSNLGDQLDTLKTVYYLIFKNSWILLKKIEIICWTTNADLFLQTFISKRHASLISLLTRNCEVHCACLLSVSDSHYTAHW